MEMTADGVEFASFLGQFRETASHTLPFSQGLVSEPKGEVEETGKSRDSRKQGWHLLDTTPGLVPGHPTEPDTPRGLYLESVAHFCCRRASYGPSVQPNISDALQPG